MKLQQITQPTTPSIESYLFVDAVLASSVLSEATGARLGALMSAAIAKLNNLLTPGADSDMEALLDLMAQGKGGWNKIKQLVDQAKEVPKKLIYHETWWDQLFDTCNIKDRTVQHEIWNAVEKEFSKAPDQTPGQNPEPAHSNNASSPGTVQVPGSEQELRTQRLRALNQNLRGLGASSGVAEALSKQIALGLLEEQTVRSNLKFVASNLRKNFGNVVHRSNEDWLQKFMVAFKAMPVVQEGIKDWVRGARHFLTNPGYATNKLNNIAQQESNLHIAKLALQIIFDYLKKELGERLRLAGLTLDDLYAIVKHWNKLHAQYLKTPSNQLGQQVAEYYETKIKPLVMTINPDYVKQDNA